MTDKQQLDTLADTAAVVRVVTATKATPRCHIVPYADGYRVGNGTFMVFIRADQVQHIERRMHWVDLVVSEDALDGYEVDARPFVILSGTHDDKYEEHPCEAYEPHTIQ